MIASLGLEVLCKRYSLKRVEHGYIFARLQVYFICGNVFFFFSNVLKSTECLQFNCLQLKSTEFFSNVCSLIVFLVIQFFVFAKMLYVWIFYFFFHSDLYCYKINYITFHFHFHITGKHQFRICTDYKETWRITDRLIFR